MKVLVRVDSGKLHSAGHLLRSLNLAREFARQGAEVCFLTKNYPNHFNSFIDKKFDVILLDQALSEDSFDDEDYSTWNDESDEQEFNRINSLIKDKGFTHLIVDHYGISSLFDQMISEHSDVTYISIDDLERTHTCDILINQNYGIEKDFYHNSVCKKLLLGPKYSLIDVSFAEARLKVLPRTVISKILIFFGGSDKSCETNKVFQAIKNNPNLKYTYTFIIPKHHIDYNRLVLESKSIDSINIVTPVKEFASFMSNFDLMFCASGATNWERCCLGIPAFSVVTADNQVVIAENLTRGGYSINLGSGFITSSTDWEEVILSLSEKESELIKMSSKCFNLADGTGCKNILTELFSLQHSS